MAEGLTLLLGTLIGSLALWRVARRIGWLRPALGLARKHPTAANGH